MVCAWIGEQLLQRGYQPENDTTVDEVEAWRGADPRAILYSPSVGYLRETRQLADIDFVLGHVDDVDAIAIYNGQQVTLLSAADQERAGLAQAT